MRKCWFVLLSCLAGCGVSSEVSETDLMSEQNQWSERNERSEHDEWLEIPVETDEPELQNHRPVADEVQPVPSVPEETITAEVTVQVLPDVVDSAPLVDEQQWTEHGYRLRILTRSYCAPCTAWVTKADKALTEAGIPFEVINTSDRPEFRRKNASYPKFEVISKRTGNVVYRGGDVPMNNLLHAAAKDWTQDECQAAADWHRQEQSRMKQEAEAKAAAENEKSGSVASGGGDVSRAEKPNWKRAKKDKRDTRR